MTNFLHMLESLVLKLQTVSVVIRFWASLASWPVVLFSESEPPTSPAQPINGWEVPGVLAQGASAVVESSQVKLRLELASTAKRHHLSLVMYCICCICLRYFMLLYCALFYVTYCNVLILTNIDMILICHMYSGEAGCELKPWHAICAEAPAARWHELQDHCTRAQPKLRRTHTTAMVGHKPQWIAMAMACSSQRVN